MALLRIINLKQWIHENMTSQIVLQVTSSSSGSGVWKLQKGRKSIPPEGRSVSWTTPPQLRSTEGRVSGDAVHVPVVQKKVNTILRQKRRERTCGVDGGRWTEPCGWWLRGGIIILIVRMTSKFNAAEVAVVLYDVVWGICVFSQQAVVVGTLWKVYL